MIFGATIIIYDQQIDKRTRKHGETSRNFHLLLCCPMPRVYTLKILHEHTLFFQVVKLDAFRHLNTPIKMLDNAYATGVAC